MGLLDRRRQIAEDLLGTNQPALPQQMEPEVGFWQAWSENAGNRLRFLGSLLDPMTWYRAIGTLPPPGSPEAKQLFRPQGQGLLDVAMDWGVNPLAGGALGIFKGMGANLSDEETQLLAKAFEMEQAGASREAIRQATNPAGGSGGWFRAPWDQKWRMEVDDSAADWADILKYKGGKRSLEEGMFAGQAINHPSMFSAYPQFARTGVIANIPPGFAAGKWMGLDDGLRLSKGTDPNAEVGTLVAAMREVGNAPNSKALQREMSGISTGLHEFQHGIQDIEGFARGGNPGMFAITPSQISATRQMKDSASLGADLVEYLSSKGVEKFPLGEVWPGWRAQEAIKEFADWQKISVDDAETALYNLVSGTGEIDRLPKYADAARLAEEAQKRYDELLTASFLSPEENYRRLAGEAESRIVEARRDLTPQQRALLDPIEQMDTMLKQEGILGGLADLITRY